MPSLPHCVSKLLFLAACLFLLAASAHQAAAADPLLASDWMEIAARERVAWPNRTPETARADAVVALAMFEAANAIERRYPSYLGLAAASAGVPANVAINAAAASALTRLYPKKRAIFEGALRARAVNDGDVDNDNDVDAHRRAIELGEAAAAAAFARGAELAGNPQAPQWNHAPSPPGVYVPEGETSAISAFDLALRPWALNSTDEVRPASPPSLSDQTYLCSVDEVRRLGAHDGSERTLEQTETASFWFFIDLNPMLRQIAERPGRSAAQNARMYAMFYMATDDAWIASADAKLHYMFWRPIAAIRSAGEDRWSPLLPTPPHPEYPCAHCVQAAAQAVVLAEELNDSDMIFTIRSSTIPAAAPRSVTLHDYVAQTVESRIYAGAHFRFSTKAGVSTGENVGRRVLERWRSPTP
jgi:hypothetical protein